MTIKLNTNKEREAHPVIKIIPQARWEDSNV